MAFLTDNGVLRAPATAAARFAPRFRGPSTAMASSGVCDEAAADRRGTPAWRNRWNPALAP